MLKINSIGQYQSNKIIDFNQVISLIQKFKLNGKTVGLCHGGFDLLHPGHVKHFESAKKLCGVLIVSITSDQFVTSRKGYGRPIYTDQLRAYITASIEFVDYVVISDFKKGVEVINLLKPSFYIKGPDFIHKNTPGITAEREAIILVGGEIKYTTESPMSTTGIIEYIKHEVNNKHILLIIDRDGTIIENNDFLGKNENWKEELKFNQAVISYLSHLQTKYNTTKIVVTNQAGVARSYFDCNRVEQINEIINSVLIKKGVKIDNWQYCPDVDSVYANEHPELNFDYNFVKDKSKRKPNTKMVDNALLKLNKELSNFDDIIVIGDRHEDKELAENLHGKFIDVNDINYEELVKKYN